jgi:hypothetical protein
MKTTSMSVTASLAHVAHSYQKRIRKLQALLRRQGQEIAILMDLVQSKKDHIAAHLSHLIKKGGSADAIEQTVGF